MAKDRFPDVVWDLVDEDDDSRGEEVWGHKGSWVFVFEDYVSVEWVMLRLVVWKESSVELTEGEYACAFPLAVTLLCGRAIRIVSSHLFANSLLPID